MTNSSLGKTLVFPEIVNLECLFQGVCVCVCVCIYQNLRCASVMCGTVDSASCPMLSLIKSTPVSVSKFYLVGVCGFLCLISHGYIIAGIYFPL